MTNDFERSMMLTVAEKMHKLRQEQNKELAIEIANAVGKLFKK